MANFTQPDSSLLFPFSPDNSFPDYREFLQAYCIAPPDDTCGPPGRCPNFDAAGILVRAASYATNYFMSLLIIYSPQTAEGSFRSLMLFVYSLLITSTISIAQRQLTRFHAALTAQLAGSPMLFVLFVYVILGTGFGYKHRMSHVLGGTRGSKKVHWRANAVVVGAMLWWTAFMIFVLRGGSKDFFSQTACDEGLVYGRVSVMVSIIPYGAVGLYIWNAVEYQSLAVIIELVPVAPVLLSVVFVMIWRRKTIRLLGNGKFLIWNAWRYIGEEFPFVHFLTSSFLNFVYWIIIIENRTRGTRDNHFILSFGQILAVFSTIPPLYASLQLLPALPPWFINLSWVRFLSCRPQKRSKVHYLIKDEGDLDAAIPFRRSRGLSEDSEMDMIEKERLTKFSDDGRPPLKPMYSWEARQGRQGVHTPQSGSWNQSYDRGSPPLNPRDPREARQARPEHTPQSARGNQSYDGGKPPMKPIDPWEANQTKPGVYTLHSGGGNQSYDGRYPPV